MTSSFMLGIDAFQLTSLSTNWIGADSGCALSFLTHSIMHANTMMARWWLRCPPTPVADAETAAIVIDPARLHHPKRRPYFSLSLSLSGSELTAGLKDK